MILLVNLRSGDVIDADEYKLRERGMPDGYCLVGDVTPFEWLNALRRAYDHPPLRRTMMATKPAQDTVLS